MRFSLVLAGLALCVFVGSQGCEVKKTTKSTHDHSDHDGHDHGDHDHGDHDGHDHGAETKGDAAKADPHAGHDHSHDVGPNGGHIAHFEPSDAHFEWAHDDDTHKLTIHVEELVSAGAKIESMEVVVTSGSDTKKFPLAADETAKIANSVYTITSQELMTLMGASGTDEKGPQSKLVALIDGKEQTCVMAHDHDHAGHKH